MILVNVLKNIIEYNFQKFKGIKMDWLSPKKKNWKERIIEQPHQLFIPIAIVYSIYIMIMTFISLLNVTKIDFSLIHGFGLIFGLFTNAFLGFLYIVIPKYTNAKVIEKKHYLITFFTYQIGMIISFIGVSGIGKIFVSLALLYSAYIFFKTIKDGQSPKKSESIWLTSLIAYAGGLLIIESIYKINLIDFTFWSYMLSVVLIIALKMIPSFFAVYFKSEFPKLNDYRVIVIFTTFFMIALSKYFDIYFLQTIFSFIGFLYLGYELKKANVIRKSPPILWILALGLLWAEIGFIFLFIESFLTDYSLRLSMHIFGLGFVMTLLFGFGSRVTLGHAVPPKPIKADKLTTIIFVLSQFLVLTRVFASLAIYLKYDFWMPLLHLSATMWVILFLVWGFKYGKILLRIE